MNTQNSEEYEDLSYEDAILDTEARLFFRAELGNAQAPDPAGAFNAVLSRIEAAEAAPQEEREPAPALMRPSFMERLHRLIASTQPARVVSGAVAVMILVAVLGSDAAQLLRNGAQHSGSTTGESSMRSAVTPESASQPAQLRTAGPTARYDAAASAQLHPVELGLERRSATGYPSTWRPVDEWYPHAGFGPE